MSTSAHERIPQWTRGDRLRKARAMTGLGVREFAERMGVSTSTVTSAELDKHGVRRITLNAWALITGVPIEWLLDGTTPEDNPDPTGARGVNVQYLDSAHLAMPLTPPRPALVAA